MRMQFLAKLHAHATVHAIFEEMQLCQYGCRSTRLDFRNAFVRDEDPTKNQINYILRNKDKIVFSIVFFQIFFVFTKIRVQVLILQHKA